MRKRKAESLTKVSALRVRQGALAYPSLSAPPLQETHMKPFETMRRTLLTGSVALLSLTLVGCETLEDQRREEWYDDVRRCAEAGVREGSRAHDRCMRQREHHRDRDRER